MTDATDPVDIVPSNRVKRHRHNRQRGADTAPFTPLDDTHTPAQDISDRVLVVMEGGKS